MKFVTIFDPKGEINFVKKFKAAGTIAFIIPLLSLIGLFTLGINWGIDFSGGVELQVKFTKDVPAGEIRDMLDEIEFDKNQVQQFGPSANHEMLIRVERMASLQEQDINRIQSIVNESFPKGQGANQNANKILFDEKSGNQLSIWLATPFSEATSDPLAQKQSIDAQKAKLSKLLASKSKVELRKSRISAGDKSDISSAVIDDDPKDGLVRYTVFFEGVSNKIQNSLESRFGKVEIRRVDFVDSQVSRQLRTDGLLSIIYALLAIVIYIAIRFDIYFSPGAIIALIHDTLGALLVFVVGRVEFDTPSIAAILTIVGYSINNTIVIYDRIRETVPANPKKPLSVEELKPYINKAVNDTLSRTINTSLTTLFASIAIWVFATGVIESFAMVLTVGILFGAFSSVFVAPATYLLAKKYIQTASSELDSKQSGPTREERAKGVV